MPDEVPDIYADSVYLAISPYDLMIRLAKRPFESGDAPAEPETVGVVRMSHEQAKTFAVVLRNLLVEYEKGHGKIRIHSELRERVGISEDGDW
ncbi:MAG: DUF3467 domain-containing protein [Armatimonadetes bacterium]|nr:DUF3467 domain-containing protein [Armatimonadota bacterium]